MFSTTWMLTRRLSIWILFVLLFLVLLGSTSNAVAQPTTFFGEDSGLGEVDRLPSTPNADAARADFLAQLTNPDTENFESFNDSKVAPLAVDFGAAGTATLQGTGEIEEVWTGTNGYGRYPISGDKYWETSDVIYIEFTEPQVAFGFYGVDVGDFSGQLTITYEDGSTQTVTIPHTVNSPGGTVIYFGFIDLDNPFTIATFGNTVPGTDFFGFDDFTIGTPLEYFDTGTGTYPSIMGTHNGTITPSGNITVSTLYTYACAGTGGHTESIELYNETDTLIANGSWNGYIGDYHNITIHNRTGGTQYVTLLENHEYNYTIVTGSYPQIHHNTSLLTTNGWINCTQFVDVNGKEYDNWIPAIRLE